MSPVEKQSFGMGGCRLLFGDETSSVGAYCAIQFVTAGVISSLITNSLSLASGSISSVTFPAGFILYIPFTQVTLASDCIAVIYRASQ